MKRTEMLQRLKAGEDPLLISIRKWEDIVANGGEDNDNLFSCHLNCALCETHPDIDCEGCIIREETDDDECISTPYVDWINADTKREKLKFAKAMLEFLNSLVPEKLEEAKE